MRVLMNFRVLLLVLLLLAVVGCKQEVAGDDTYSLALNYLKDNKYKKSYELMLKEAHAGNNKAQNYVAWMNMVGV